MLQISTKTHATRSSHLELAGRAFLRNFITTTLTYRLQAPKRSGSREDSFDNYHLIGARVFNYHICQGEAMGHVDKQVSVKARRTKQVELNNPGCVCFAATCLSTCPIARPW